MGLVCWTKSLIISYWFIWISTIILSRLHAFNEIYVSEKQKIIDERYLLEKCNDNEFFSNIRQHTDICIQVFYSMSFYVILFHSKSFYFIQSLSIHSRSSAEALLCLHGIIMDLRLIYFIIFHSIFIRSAALSSLFNIV
jgi:hypothetical protein